MAPLTALSALFMFCAHSGSPFSEAIEHPSETRTCQGYCHCGAVTFSVHTDLSGLSDGKCSCCRFLGWVMQAVPAASVSLTTGSDLLKAYRFNTEMIDHLFCPECGIEPMARGTDGQGQLTYMVNVNCLEGVPDFDRAAIRHWDGASF